MIQAEVPAGAVIGLAGLTKRYGRQTVVDGLSLAVPEGAIFGLLGENGAGKTTTIQMLLGLVKPDGGRVAVQGLDPTRAGARGAPARWLRAGSACALRLDDRRRNRLVCFRVPP